ncbi:MAG: hypothetical protein AAB710_02530 [Patescibacteria group bacterium]
MRPRENLEIAHAINFTPEEIVPRNSNHVPLTDIVLGSIAIAGLISVAVIAPNAVQLFKYVKFKQKPKYDLGYRIPETVRRLEKQGYITLTRKNNVVQASITPLGRTVLIKKKFRYAKGNKQKWDKKWRFVIFDVKETFKIRRDRFRDELKLIGFVRVQNSVWAFPYECKEIVSLLKMEREIGDQVLYLEADYIENDSTLRHKFQLT